MHCIACMLGVSTGHSLIHSFWDVILLRAYRTYVHASISRLKISRDKKFVHMKMSIYRKDKSCFRKTSRVSLLARRAWPLCPSLILEWRFIQIVESYLSFHSIPAPLGTLHSLLAIDACHFPIDHHELGFLNHSTVQRRSINN